MIAEWRCRNSDCGKNLPQKIQQGSTEGCCLQSIKANSSAPESFMSMVNEKLGDIILAHSKEMIEMVINKNEPDMTLCCMKTSLEFTQTAIEDTECEVPSAWQELHVIRAN